MDGYMESRCSGHFPLQTLKHGLRENSCSPAVLSAIIVLSMKPQMTYICFNDKLTSHVRVDRSAEKTTNARPKHLRTV